MIRLPIDAHLDELVEQVRKHPISSLEAPPGTGKTTRVPVALAQAFPGQVWVLEPRRLAARWSSQRVAREQGWTWGQEVGYQVRFEDFTSPSSRLIFQTQGVFTRRLLSRPELDGVDVVILDEFHERSLDNDVALAWLRHLQAQGRGPRVLILSATLPDPLLELGPRLTCSVPLHPVEQIYLQPRGGLDAAVREAVEKHAPRNGHTLVFLPGLREMRTCQRELESLAQLRGAEICLLHGSLSNQEQDRVLEPSQRARWILATNVAETSLTIPGVLCVIDSGLARQYQHRPGRSAPLLEVARISQFSARQRAGRAGRTAPGKCVRLFGEAEFQARPAHEPCELLRTPLDSLLLYLATLQAEPEQLPWLDAPPPARWSEARQLLEDLAALEGGRLTQLGASMARLPLPPRLARFALSVPSLRAAIVAVSVSEGQLKHPDALLAQHAPALQRQVEALVRALPPLRRQVSDDELSQALLASYPDRVGRILRGRDLLLCDGNSMKLPESSEGWPDGMIVALDLQESGMKGAAGQLLAYATLTPEMLLERPELSEETSLEWQAPQVYRITRLRYRQLLLEESRRRAEASPEAAELLWRGAQESSWWRQMEEHFDSFTARCEQAGIAAVDRLDWLRHACEGRTSLAELEGFKHPSDSLSHEQRRRLERLCPGWIQLNRRRYPVHYEAGKPPWVAAPLVEFFNLAQGPRLGERPLTLHLLAPNRRPVQITSDLEGFWQRHYPKIRQELCRRYPKHPWPENPLQAQLDWRPTRKD